MVGKFGELSAKLSKAKENLASCCMEHPMQLSFGEFLVSHQFCQILVVPKFPSIRYIIMPLVMKCLKHLLFPGLSLHF